MTDGPTANVIRGGIVGFGFISEKGHVPAYGALAKRGGPFRIEAVADICAERREIAKRVIPGVRTYESYERMLEGEQRTLDFVDVSAPPSEHAKVSLAALSRGLHVLCEKPLATTLEDAKAMIATAKKERRVIHPCHNYKHAPVVKAVRKILDSGVIGKVSLVTLQTFRNTHAKGVKEWRTDWRREQRFSGGGIGMDHGSHTFYLAFDWLGAYPTAITAKASTIGDFDTEDNFNCAITFPGGTASAHLTWTAGIRRVIYTIHGERGAIRVEDDDVELTVQKQGTEGKILWEKSVESVASHWMDASHAIWFESLLGQFKTAIDKGDFAGKEAEDGVRCVELITTAYASTRESSRELPLGVNLAG